MGNDNKYAVAYGNPWMGFTSLALSTAKQMPLFMLKAKAPEIGG